jgi:hypothetical protein
MSSSVSTLVDICNTEYIIIIIIIVVVVVVIMIIIPL